MDLTSFCSIDNAEGVCLPPDTINKLADNILVKSDEHNNHKDKIEAIKDQLDCDDEICVLKKTKALSEDEKRELLFTCFKPIASVDPVKWLSNMHLDQLQEQLYKIHDNYYYSFIHMIDFVMINHEHVDILGHPIIPIQKIDFVSEIDKNTNSNRIISTNDKPLTMYGVVFNTDPSNKSGQHWFSLFFDFRGSGTINDPYTLEYFNSAGSKIPKPLYKFLINLANDISSKTKKICNYITITNIQHQSSKTGNCGAYSLYYIHNRINGVEREAFNKPSIPLDDNLITKFREIIFIDEKKVR